MFDAKIKSEILKEAVDAINILVDEAKINVTKDELHIRAVDPAHVAMINFKLNKKAFEDYKAKECELGVDLDKIKEILKLVKSGDVIHLKQDEEKNRLVIRFGNLTRRMSLVDTAGMSDPKMPNLEFSTKATISTGELRRAVKASENVSDHITLMVSRTLSIAHPLCSTGCAILNVRDTLQYTCESDNFKRLELHCPTIF